MFKRTVAAIAGTALLATSVLSSAAVGAAADAPFDPSAYGVTGTLTQAVGFDSYDAGTDLVTAGIVTDSSPAAQTLTIAQGGLSGKALQWHAIAADSKRVTIPLQDGDVSDWSGAQELWVYVDQSAYMKPGSTNYTQNSNSFGLGFVAGGAAVSYANGAAVQYYENGRWVTSPYVEWGRTTLPGHYTGWVRVELNAANFGGLDVTKLSDVTAITIEVGHPAGAYVDNADDNACLVDAVCLLTGKQTTPTDEVDPASPVDFTQVHIDDPYWSAYQKLFICEVIPTGIANVELPTGGIPNIINAAKMHRGQAHGGWQGQICGVETDVFKLVEAMCFALQMDANGDAEITAGQQVIRDKLDEWVGYMVDLPDETGYIYTYYTLRPTAQRWTNWDDHELYNSGHFFEMAVAYYNALGDTALLDVAVENADMLCDTFGPADGQIHQVPGHPEVELALIKLANTCLAAGGAYADRADDYVALCQYFIDLRGDHSNRTGSNPHASTYNQDHAAMVNQREAVGHAVRAGYTYTGVADLALYTKTDKYTTALQAIWEDIAYRKSYITGGIGSVAGIEGFGAAYELGNAAAYNETCASCAQMFFSKSMGLLYGDSRYADEIERNLYNILLASMNMDGDRFFYNNRMQSDGSIDRQAWYGCACCPPNLMRTVMSIGGYIYTTKDTTLTIDQYIGNTADVTVDGAAVGIDLDTTMPWEGQTTLTLSLDASKQMTLRFRLPYWATGTNTAAVNGSAVTVEADDDGYLTITRTWADSDTVTLDFAVEAQRVYSDPRVTTNAGLVAVQRGPFIYAAEQIDNAVIPQRYVLSTDAVFTEADKDILPAADDHYGIRTVKAVTADAQIMSENGTLTDATLTLVPYYAWNNRGTGNMTVYLHEEPVDLLDEGYTLEAFADATASGSQSGYGAENLNDETAACWVSDATAGTAWVEYAWDSAVELSSLTATWMSGTAGAKLPAGVAIEAWDGEDFVPVTLRGVAQTPVSGQAITYDFLPVETTKIRLVITLDGRAAIAEMRVNLNAGHAVTGTLTEVLGFDEYPAGNVSSLDDFSLLWADRQWNVEQSLSITTKNSLRGKALNWIATLPDSIPVGVKLPAAAADWSGAQEVWVYVDSTLYGNQGTSFRLSFVADGVESTLKDCTGGNGGVVYYQSGHGFVQATDIAWGRVTLPGKFKGWVRMPLSADTFNNFDASRLSNVTSVGFEVGHTADGMKSQDGFFIDAVSLLYAGEGDPLEPAYTLGDVNADGQVSVSDVRLALRAAVGKITLSDAQRLAADVTGDGQVSVSDVRRILRYAVGKITTWD